MQTYGLIGFPLGHSFSKNYFNQKFVDEHIDAQYINFEISHIKQLNGVIEMHPEMKGFNVTIPYKEQIIPFLCQLSPEAKAIGAVNVVKIRREGRKALLKGYNTDTIAFRQSVTNLLQPHHKQALILGTGGAAKAVAYALTQLHIKVQFVSRQQKTDCITYEQLTPEIIQTHSVIVNCTPLGMYPNADSCPPLPYHAMSAQTLLYDLIYNPDQTLFMRNGAARGATTKNGLEMLLLQAFLSWQIWNS